MEVRGLIGFLGGGRAVGALAGGGGFEAFVVGEGYF